MKWLVVLGLIGCSAGAPSAPPQTVVIERIVYVERAAEAPSERAEPSEPIAESPLLVAEEERREERAVERVESAPSVVYVETPVPVYVERAESRRLSTIDRQRLGRELERCDRRATRFARERCEERARAR